MLVGCACNHRTPQQVQQDCHKFKAILICIVSFQPAKDTVILCYMFECVCAYMCAHVCVLALLPHMCLCLNAVLRLVFSVCSLAFTVYLIDVLNDSYSICEQKVCFHFELHLCSVIRLFLTFQHFIQVVNLADQFQSKCYLLLSQILSPQVFRFHPQFLFYRRKLCFGDSMLLLG